MSSFEEDPDIFPEEDIPVLSVPSGGEGWCCDRNVRRKANCSFKIGMGQQMPKMQRMKLNPLEIMTLPLKIIRRLWSWGRFQQLFLRIVQNVY